VSRHEDAVVRGRACRLPAASHAAQLPDPAQRALIGAATGVDVPAAYLNREFRRKQKMFLAVIDRWIEHPGAEVAWTSLAEALARAKRAGLAPRIFIAEILQRRDAADLLDRPIAGQAELEKEILDKIKKLTKEAKGTVKARKYREAAVAFELLADLTEGRERVVGRKGKTGARQHFIRDLSERFVTLTGEPLDPVVQVLVEVAFGNEVPTETVRKAREKMVRKARKIRPSK
jgi:hypothetical protein